MRSMGNALGFGFKVGHWTEPEVRTGCTVIIPPRGNVSSCDIRGSSPSSREIEHLNPDRRLTETHAILLTGSSAFGLAAADGVVEWLAEKGIGYDTRAAVVPIVPAAVILDLGVTLPDSRPGPPEGRAACEDATEDERPGGRVGAGAGATVGKWAGFEHRSPGGIGFGHASEGDLEVSALSVVNAVGDVLDEDGTVIAGTTSSEPRLFPPPQPTQPVPGNTVLTLVATRATLEKRDVRWIASRGSDGVTVSVRPAHTRYDGDVTFAVAAPGERPAEQVEIDILGALATTAVARAVRNAVV